MGLVMMSRTLAPLYCVIALLPGLVICSTPTAREYKALQSNPAILYQCYRNATTPDREQSVNYTSLFDGTDPGNDNATVTVWFAINGTQDQVVRYSFPAYYDRHTDKIAFSYGGRSAEVSLLHDPYDGRVFFINEFFEGQVFGQIYDVEESCVNAQEKYRELCPNGCHGMKPTRKFGRNPSRHC